MNYLTLCQRLGRKVGAAGDGTPTTVIGQRGESARLVDWIDEAWMEIQSFRPNWSWAHRGATASTVIGQQAYNAGSFGIADLGSWDLRDAHLFDVDANDERYLQYMDYDIFSRRYLLGNVTQARPGYVSQNKANQLVLYPIPDKAYTLNVDYHQAAQHLVDNVDIPAVPEQFHMLIVYKAMEYYGRFENAPEVVQDGSLQFYQMLERLEENQMAEVTMAAPLI